MFQQLPFYNALIGKQHIKRVKNIDLLNELLIYVDLIIVKISEGFKRYARSYKTEIDWKDPLRQLETSKSSIEDLFQDLLDEIEDFKYQVTVKTLLSKHKKMEM